MKPRISFTFPYRWLVDKEDRKFLKENLVNLANRNQIKPVLDPVLQQRIGLFIGSYAVILKYHAFDPVKIPLTQEEIKKIFKEVFPGAKLIGFRKKFVQVESVTQLPIIELEIYH